MKKNKKLILGILAIFILAAVGGALFFYKTENKKEKKEIIGDLVTVRSLDKNLILEKIKNGKEYLLRMIDKKEKGVHKYYYAPEDTFENRLHTIYTSSAIYTLLRIYGAEKDESLLKQIFDLAEFVLSMQNKDKKSKAYGAFYYSYYLDANEKEQYFVTGTTAKTIFTLLELYKLTADSKYLESAKLGADWLIVMQEPDGRIASYKKYRDGKWFYSAKYSLLYNGQVLSAFSRLFDIQKEEKYYQAAEKIAKDLVGQVEKEGCYLGDDYRAKNPISSSWAVLSLLDFYKISRQEGYKNIVFECGRDILERQITKSDDVVDNGRWQGAYSTSGVGWITEVTTEVYEFCKNEGENDCDKYKTAVVRAIRWLIQNTYSEENTFSLKNPEMAIGGIPWSQQDKYVRTDSVSHALNSYLRIIDDLPDGLLLSIPEKLF